MSVDEELDKLQKLRDAGTITDEQFERARAKLLDGEPEGRSERDERRPRRRDEPDEYDRRPRKKVREWSMILHLSLFAGHIVPGGGIVAPIVIWQTQKDEMPEIDAHGKNAVNWIISFIIYMIVSAILCLVFIGFVLLPIVLVLNVVFPIIAAVKANEGEVWKYPLSIPFFK